MAEFAVEMQDVVKQFVTPEGGILAAVNHVTMQIRDGEFFSLLGPSGCGKTTLAHQIVFANATLQKTALYFTVLGEPALKMLRYQQQFSFFDRTFSRSSTRC